MDKVYKFDSIFILNPDEVGEIKAPFHDITMALNILSKEEFELWKRLVEISDITPGLYRNWLDLTGMKKGESASEIWLGDK
jgi:hypothetical protein